MTSWSPADVTRAVEWSAWTEATVEKLDETDLLCVLEARLSPLLSSYLLCCGELELGLRELRNASQLLKKRLLANPLLSADQRAVLAAEGGPVLDLEAEALDLLRPLKASGGAAAAVARTEAVLLWRHLQHLQLSGGETAVAAFLQLCVSSCGLEQLLRWILEPLEGCKAQEVVSAAAVWLEGRLESSAESCEAVWRVSPTVWSAAAFGVLRRGGLWRCYERALSAGASDADAQRHLEFWGRRTEK